MLPYADNALTYHYARELPTGIDLAHYVSTSPSNVWYGPIGTEVHLQQRAPHFLGFLTIAACLFAFGSWARRRGSEPPQALLPPRVWVPVSLALGLLLVLLSAGRDVSVFGHELFPGPYRLLFEYVPGFTLVRIPERLGFAAMLFFGLLAGRAVALVGEAGWPRAALVLALLVPLEHLSPIRATESMPVDRELPAVYTWLAESPAAAVAEVPIHGEALIRKETLEMYFSLRHLKPIIHGYPAFTPLLSTVLRRMAEQFPEDVSLAGLSRAGVDTVVVHQGRPGGESILERAREQVAALRLRRLARFAGQAARPFDGVADEVYGIVSAPDLAVAAMPEGRRLREAQWQYRTKRGDPAGAADGDTASTWSVKGPLLGDEFYEIRFGRPIRVSGVLLRLRQDSRFPTRFKIGAQRADGAWVPLAFYDAAHQLQLLERLLSSPTDPVLGFDWPDQELSGIVVMLDGDGHSALGWSVPEIEVLVPE